ncbi:sensory rhodopsin transducer [Croceibacterium aestuarii]|uniref:sensory rhodopsin transducer n=1 Tax=Croceibacterium aestuarii TaxID=3064139 RepID=UPI00272DD53D|nr:sensory rhodopsin transducer [Croceibacterium sp. D39]
MDSIGRKRWVIAEGYIPDGSMAGADETLISHEAACILNTGDEDAEVEITIFFTDREPAGPYRLSVEARRTRHLRFNDLDHPERVPRGTSYASVIESDRPIVVQHTRLDSRAAEISLMTTMAFAAD